MRTALVTFESAYDWELPNFVTSRQRAHSEQRAVIADRGSRQNA